MFLIFIIILNTYPDQAYLAKPIIDDSFDSMVLGGTTTFSPRSKHAYINRNTYAYIFIQKNQHTKIIY